MYQQKASTWRRLQKALPATLKDSSIERTAERDVEGDQNGQTSAEVPVVNARKQRQHAPSSHVGHHATSSALWSHSWRCPSRSDENIGWPRGQSCAESLVRISSRMRVRSWSTNVVASERSRSSSSWWRTLLRSLGTLALVQVTVGCHVYDWRRRCTGDPRYGHPALGGWRGRHMLDHWS